MLFCTPTTNKRKVHKMRYSLQEMNFSGYTYYEIIDTENKCKVIFTTKNYSKAIEKLIELNIDTNTELLYNSNLDKWETKTEIINIIMGMGYTEEEAGNILDDSIKQCILYTKEGYNKHFEPYEN